MLGSKVLKYIFDHYMSWRLDTLIYPKYPIILDYPFKSIPRYGFGKPPHPRLNEVIQKNRQQYAETLQSFLQFGEDLARIGDQEPLGAGRSNPYWLNNFFTGLDATALYGFISLKKPAIYFEIGSGNSTKFARQAIIDQKLNTKIISCDPFPRAEIDAICDEVIRSPVEDIDLVVFDQLCAGDILFIDNSHRTFMNSDATVVFLDILPRLAKGVIVHIHDIFLPLDYPKEWSERYYSEQYLLAASLLAKESNFDILLPNVFVGLDKELSVLIQPLWDKPELRDAYNHSVATYLGFQGFSFWLEVI